jgi:hypothetical protein
LTSQPHVCLFCKRSDGSFTTEEHIIAAALGNTRGSGLVSQELVLPPGTVCDRCNNGRLSVLDNALATWPLIAAYRTITQVPRRRGGLAPTVEGIRWSGQHDPHDVRRITVNALVSAGPQKQRLNVVRFMFKAALEMAALLDPADAFSSRDSGAAVLPGRRAP